MRSAVSVSTLDVENPDKAASLIRGAAATPSGQPVDQIRVRVRNRVGMVGLVEVL